MDREEWIHDWRQLAASVEVPPGAVHIVDSWVVGTPAPPRPEPKAVPLLTKAANFASAVAQHVAAGMPQASAELVAARLAVCQKGEGLSPDQINGEACDHYRASDNTCGGANGCGCYLAEKSKWRDQSCPLGRWPMEA